MSEYLKRLKALKSENTLTLEPSKPSKDPFEGFEGDHPGHFQKKDSQPGPTGGGSAWLPGCELAPTGGAGHDVRSGPWPFLPGVHVTSQRVRGES
jgi:hypothetical protein